MNYSIAVFIPVFNGEKYLNETINSILNQTYNNYIIYCVDDSSTDNSYGILEDFSKKDYRIKIFKKKNGGATANSWNYILPNIKEDFIFYMSQDDIISINLFEEMLLKFEESKADCVIPNMVYYKNKFDDTGLFFDSNDKSINGKEAFIKSLFWEIHGFVLRKRILYKDEVFPEDCFDSDELMTRKLFLKSKKISFSKGIFYYRQNNPDAITKKFSNKNFYSLKTYIRVYELFYEFRVKNNYKEQVKWLLFIIYQYKYLLSNFENIKDSNEKIEIRNILISTRIKLIKLIADLRISKLSLKLYKEYLKLILIR